MFDWFIKKKEKGLVDFDERFVHLIEQFVKTQKFFCADTHFYLHILANRTYLTEHLFKVKVIISQETIQELLYFANAHNKKIQKKLAQIALQQLDLISQRGTLYVIPVTKNKLHFKRYLDSLNLNFCHTFDRMLGYYFKLTKDLGHDLVLFTEDTYAIKTAKRVKFPIASTFHKNIPV